MTPFFILSVFITVTKDSPTREKQALAFKVIFSVIITCIILLFFGRFIFLIFGITVDAFRIGAGALLFLVAVDLVGGSAAKSQFDGTPISLAVVPLAIPVILGPAAIGTIMIIGDEAESFSQRIGLLITFSCAIFCVGIILLLSSQIEKLLGKNGIVVLSKITGLILSALSAQMVFDGIKGILNL